MVSAIISRVLLLTAGTLYPAYRSYKGIKTKNVREYVKWMMYWIVFALYLCVEAVADIFVAFWCPLYYELKILFVIWLLSPYTKGASLLYRKFLHPFLVKHEQEIDLCLEKFKTESYSRMVDIGHKGLIYAREAVAVAALRSHDHIVGQIRKTVSLNDVTDSPSRARNALQYTAADVLDEEMYDDDQAGGEPALASVNSRRRVKPARVRPGLNHVIKRSAKMENAIEQGIDCSDTANLEDDESAYVIDQEFGYLDEQDDMESNERLDETYEEEEDEISQSSKSGQSKLLRRRGSSTREDGVPRNNAGPPHARSGKDAMYATLPRRSQRKEIFRPYRMVDKPIFPYLKRGQGIEKRYGRINYPKFGASPSLQLQPSNFETFGVEKIGGTFQSSSGVEKIGGKFQRNSYALHRKQFPTLHRSMDSLHSAVFSDQSSSSSDGMLKHTDESVATLHQQYKVAPTLHRSMDDVVQCGKFYDESSDSTLQRSDESDSTLHRKCGSNEPMVRPASSPDSGRGTTTERTDLADLNREIVRRIKQSHALFSPESDCTDASPRDPKLNLDVHSFEMLEHLAENTSLSSDSSIIHKIDKLEAYNSACEMQNSCSDEKFQRHRLSTVQEVTNENTHGENSEFSQKSKNRFGPESENLTGYLDNGEILKSTSSQNPPAMPDTGHPMNEPPKFDHAADTPAVLMRNFANLSIQLPPTLRNFVANGASNDFMSQFPFVIPQHLKRTSEPFKSVENFHNVQQGGVNNALHNANFLKQRQENLRKVKMLEKRLRDLYELLRKDADNVADMRCKVEERKNAVENESTELKKRKNAFDVRMEKELASLRKEYKDLEREQHAFSKEQNFSKRKDEEMIKILKAEIAELNERLNEKEANLSSSRYSLRESQRKLTENEESAKILQNRYKNLDEQLAKANKEIATLRCQNWKLNANTPTSNGRGSAGGSSSNRAGRFRSVNRQSDTATEPSVKSVIDESESSDEGEDRPRAKTVRFLLPNESFSSKRTQNRSAQTQLDVDGSDAVLQSGSRTASVADILQARLGRPQQFQMAKPIERLKIDGSKEIVHGNGTVEEILPDGSTVYTYTNGDTRKIDKNFAQTYHFASSNVTQVDDLLGEFQHIFYGSNNRQEKHFKDGRVEILTADGVKRLLAPDGSETAEYPDGSVSRRSSGGEEILSFPDGSKEIRTKEYIKREMPNGDVKFRYADGSEETRLTNGWHRIRDPTGVLIKDEMTSSKIDR